MSKDGNPTSKIDIIRKHPYATVIAFMMALTYAFYQTEPYFTVIPVVGIIVTLYMWKRGEKSNDVQQ